MSAPEIESHWYANGDESAFRWIVDQSAPRCVARTGKAEAVHYHAKGEGCSGKCVIVAPAGAVAAGPIVHGALS